MNCANHPETPIAAYCQNCGKPLCSQCVRQVAGVVYCEPCLAAKLATPPAQAGTYNVNVGDSGQFQYSASGPLPPGGMPPGGPSPALATILGFIPGVGAMYNGQFAKALVHVLVFFILVSVTSDHGIFGIFIAAWVLYQVFEAHYTATAKRDGLPLPDPFGLNDLGVRLGFQQPRPTAYTSAPPPPYAPGFTGDPLYPPPYTTPGPGVYPPVGAAGVADPGPGGIPVSGSTGAYPPGTYPPAAYPPYDPAAPAGPFTPANQSHPLPIGAMVLIGLGLLFLLETLGVLRFGWIGHGWPILLIALGVWIFVKRSRDVPPGGGL